MPLRQSTIEIFSALSFPRWNLIVRAIFNRCSSARSICPLYREVCSDETQCRKQSWMDSSSFYILEDESRNFPWILFSNEDVTWVSYWLKFFIDFKINSCNFFHNRCNNEWLYYFLTLFKNIFLCIFLINDKRIKIKLFVNYYYL